MLLANLRMDATYIKEGMNIKWVAEVCIFKNSLHCTVVLFHVNLVVSFLFIYILRESLAGSKENPMCVPNIVVLDNTF